MIPDPRIYLPCDDCGKPSFPLIIVDYRARNSPLHVKQMPPLKFCYDCVYPKPVQVHASAVRKPTKRNAAKQRQGSH